MKDIYGKCGCNCGRCPAFKAHAKTMEDRKHCQNAWNKYLGTNLKKFEWIYCDGCQTPDPWKSGNVLPDRTCNLRPCAIKMKITTCAQCSAYPCEELTERIPGKDFRKRVTHRLGKPISEKDYRAFVEPYEGLKHLQEIRASLSPKDIVKMPEIEPLKARIVAFPKELPFPKKKKSAFESLHRLFMNILTARTKTYARQVLIKRRQQHFLSLLWIFGRYGKFKKKNSPHVVIDSDTLNSVPDFKSIIRKYDNTVHSTVKQCFRIFKDYGIHGEYVTPKKKERLLRLSFTKRAGGIDALKALKSYVSRLVDTFGEPTYVGASQYKGKSFERFSMADMQMFIKKGK